MRWPWTARIEAAEQRATAAEFRAISVEELLRRADERFDSLTADANRRIGDALTERDDARADNKLLLDRIVQMSGQPPIFHPAPTQATPPAVPTPQISTLPAPETRVSFSDVHNAARKAIKNGDLTLLTRVG